MDTLFFLDGVDGQLEVYENKIVIKRNGLASRSIHGKCGDKSIPINSIKYVSLREWTIWKRGEIEFGLNSVPAKVNIFDSNKNRENCIIFTGEYNDTAIKIKEYLEQRISEINNNSSSTSDKNFDVCDEIQKYKKLLDIGAITQDEYDLKKKQLLNL